MPCATQAATQGGTGTDPPQLQRPQRNDVEAFAVIAHGPDRGNK
jgi:hypothetical protein